MNEALLPVVNGLEFLSPPLPQEKQETLVRRVLEQGAVENLPAREGLHSGTRHRAGRSGSA